jgi:hypothetical protein
MITRQNISIDVSVKDAPKLTEERLINFYMFQEIGKIPYCQLSFRIPKILSNAYTYMYNPFTVTLKHLKEQETWEFVVFNYSLKPHEGEFILTLSGFNNVLDFMFKGYQKVFPNSELFEISKQLKNIKVLTEYSSESKMDWINYNKPEKFFFDEMVENTFISKTTFPLYAFTKNKTIKLIDVEKEMKKEPIVKYNNTKGDKHYMSFNIESKNFFQFSNQHKEDVYYNIEDRDIFYKSETPELKYVKELPQYVNSAIVFNEDNVYKDFTRAKYINRMNLYSYLRTKLTLNTSFYDEKIQPLSVIHFNGDNLSDTIFNGKYLVFNRKIAMDTKGINITFDLHRNIVKGSS